MRRIRYLNPSHTLPFAALTLGCTLSACAWLPAKHDAPALQQQAPLHAPAETTPGTWPSTAWWQRYDDPILNELVERALRDSPSLSQAEARLSLARETVRVTAAADGLHVAADASVMRQRLSDNGLFPTEFLGFNWYTQSDLGLKASYHFDWWHQREQLTHASLYTARAAQAEAQAARITLSGAVVESYLGWQADQAQLDNINAQLAATDQLAHIGAARLKAQLDNSDPGLQLAVQRAALERQKVQWQFSASLRRVLIASLVGTSESELPPFAVKTPPQPEATLPDQLTIDLLAHRTDISSAYWRVKANEQQLGAARAAFMPDVSLNALAALSSVKLDKLLQYGSRTPAAGIAVQLPLFDSGLLKAQYGAQAAQLDAAVATYNQTVIDAARDVMTSVVKLNQLRAEQAQQQQQLTSLDRLFKSSSQRQQRGLTDARPVLNAQLAVLQQQAQTLLLDAAYRQADLKLQLALGGGYANQTGPSSETDRSNLTSSPGTQAQARTPN